MLRFLALLIMFLPQNNPPPDQRIGSAAFRIFRQGNNVIAIPVIPPEFKLAVMEGPNPVTDEIMSCGVYAHFLSADDSSMVATVLKCGESVYGVKEVDFEMSERKKK